MSAVPATMRLSIWWHRKRNAGHHSLLFHVASASRRGYLVRCSGCDRTWAA